MERRKLADNIYLTWVPSEKFKTSCLSAQWITPLSQETAGQNALLVNVLSRGTARYPDVTAISRWLDRLYGATLEPVVRCMGDKHVTGFIASCVDDRLVPEKEQLLEPLCALMGEMFCAPVMVRGTFNKEYVYSERMNLTDLIRSEINQKSAYAYRRMLEKMCAGEPLGIGRLGKAWQVERISASSLFRYYHTLLPSARIELYYGGYAPRERVEAAFGEAFAALPRGVPWEESTPALPKPPPKICRRIVETKEVSQGDLVIGFRVLSQDIPANMLLNAMFGGTPTSRLFLQVRESLSLCYYIDSSYYRRHGVLTVSAGIAFEQYDRTVQEIVSQLETLQTGDWADWELESARSSLRNAFRMGMESLRSWENFIMGELATGGTHTMSSLLADIELVTEERVRAAAHSVKLDTVYFLKGGETLS